MLSSRSKGKPCKSIPLMVLCWLLIFDWLHPAVHVHVGSHITSAQISSAHHQWSLSLFSTSKSLGLNWLAMFCLLMGRVELVSSCSLWQPRRSTEDLRIRDIFQFMIFMLCTHLEIEFCWHLQCLFLLCCVLKKKLKIHYCHVSQELTMLVPAWVSHTNIFIATT